MRSLIIVLFSLLSFYITAQEFDAAKALNIIRAHDLIDPFPEILVPNPRLAADRFGNFYYSGNLKDTLRISGTDDMISEGGYDGYLIKFNSDFTIAWAKQLSGVQDQTVVDVATDQQGNIYITGRAQGETNFDNQTFPSSCSFIIKYATDGTILWTKQFAGVSTVVPLKILTMNNGDLVVSGGFYPSVDFGCGILTSPASKTKFIARFNSAGECQMATSFEASYVFDMATDGFNNIVLTGGFSNFALFGTTLIQSNYQNIYVAKCDKYGNWDWVHNFGGVLDDQGHGVSIDPLGNTILTGYFKGTVSFGGTSLTSTGASDIFIASFDDSGSINWVQQAGGGSGNQYAFSLHTDSAANIIISGSIIDITHFGDHTIDPQGEGTFVALYNTEGVCEWATAVTGSHSRGLDLDSGSGKILLAGESYGVNSILNFGAHSINTRDQDSYIARIQYDPGENIIVAPIRYEWIQDNSLINTKGPTLGSAWGDFNQDGHEDLLAVNYAGYANFLFQNNGNESFTTNPNLGLFANEDNYSASWGDYNNDGFPDLFLADYTGYSSLYHNINGQSFEKITAGEVVNTEFEAWDASWVDFNNDGFLDLFIVSNSGKHLYKGNGTGQFEKFNDAAISSSGGAAFSFAWGDFNNDGFQDLFVTNFGNQNNMLFKNQNGESFFRIMSGSIVNDGGQSRSASWGDYNNDGYLDLFVSNSGQTNFLYKNNGDETFTKITNDPVVNFSNWSYSSTWTDYDSDGFLDLAIVRSSDTDSVSLFRNNHNGSFTRIKDKILIATGTSSWSITPNDFNNDGYEDLYVAGRGFNAGYLFKNLESTNNFLSVKLEGTTVNKMAIGTAVHIKHNGQSQTKVVSAKSGRASQGGIKLNFGIGQSNLIDTVEIIWNQNKHQLLTNIEANEQLNIRECNKYDLTVSRSICSGEVFAFGTQQLYEPGEYQEVFRSISGCDSLVHLTLSMPIINSEIKAEGNILKATQNNAEYQWGKCLGDSFSLLEENDLQTFEPGEDGNYGVKIMKDGCEKISDCIEFVVTSTYEEILQKGITLYPNPVNDVLWIDFPEVHVEYTVTISSYDGKVLLKSKYEDTKTIEVPTNNLPTGLYFITINYFDTLVKTRFLKN